MADNDVSRGQITNAVFYNIYRQFSSIAGVIFPCHDQGVLWEFAKKFPTLLQHI